MGRFRVLQVIQYLGEIEMDRNEAANSGLLGGGGEKGDFSGSFLSWAQGEL